MSEALIRKLAAQFGLLVDKTITTGNPQGGFATFALTGPVDLVIRAWRSVAEECHSRGVHRDFYYLRHSDADHSPYIAIESVWTTEEAAS